MKFIIAKGIWKQFPGLNIGVVVGKGLNNQGSNPEIDGLLRTVEESVEVAFKQFEFPQAHPNLAEWRKVYKQFGADPKDFRCSVEALVRRVLKGDQVRHINKLVDIYNYISLKHILPVGGEDIDTMAGDLVLDFAKGDEGFIVLGGTENEPPEEGEVVYKDDQGVICRRWNWREGDRTKLEEHTKNAVLVIEGMPPTGREELEQATNELKELVEKYCGGKVTSAILNSESPELSF